MLAERLLAIAEDRVTEGAALTCATDVGLDVTETSRLRDYALARTGAIRDLATAMPESDDEIELYRTLAAFWLELRFEWQRNNEVMNYQTVLRGAADPRVVAEGSIGSFVLSRIEVMLDPAHLELLARYAIELLGTVTVASGHKEAVS